VADQLVVSRGDASELLEAREHALDAVALLVEARVAGVFDRPVRPGRDDGLGSDLAQGAVEMIGVVGFVGDDGGGPQAFEKLRSIEHVATMARAQDEADRQAKGVDAGVDLGPKPAP
jgi:hypothetical protein